MRRPIETKDTKQIVLLCFMEGWELKDYIFAALAIFAYPLALLWKYIFKNKDVVLRWLGVALFLYFGIIHPIIGVFKTYYNQPFNKDWVLSVVILVSLAFLNAVIAMAIVDRRHMHRHVDKQIKRYELSTWIEKVKKNNQLLEQKTEQNKAPFRNG